MRIEPEQLTAAELVAVLRDMVARIEAGDSYDGHLMYSANDTGTELFGVVANYRVGNLQGQGGQRRIGFYGDPEPR